MNMGAQIGGAVTAQLTPWIAREFGWTASFLVAAALCVLGQPRGFWWTRNAASYPMQGHGSSVQAAEVDAARSATDKPGWPTLLARREWNASCHPIVSPDLAQYA